MKLKNMFSVDYTFSCLCVLLQILLLITQVTSSKDFTVTFECPQDWKLIGTHCFYFVTTELDFYDSFDACNKYGAVLLNVRDEVEAKNISLECKNVFHQDHYWISNGCSDDSTCKSFISPNCSGYWQINEPSTLEGDIAVSSNLFGRWALKSAWTSLPFVCRAPACPTDTFRCSDGTCLNQRWKCDNVLDCSDGSDENDCSDCYKHYKSSNGTINSNNDDNCQWILEGTPGQVLHIYFESLILVENLATVFVYSGGSTIQKSTLMKELKVNNTGITIYGVNHFLIIRLRSYGSSPKPVIKATWMADTELSNVQVKNITIEDTIETISTPYFNSSIVPSTYKKKWILTTDVNSVITVEITNTTFDLKTTELTISPVSFFLYEPNTNRAIYISTSSSLTVIAKVNEQENKRLRAKIWKGCNFNTTLTLATLELREAFVNRDCLWRIQNLLPTDFTMTLMNIQFHESTDWLKVYNGTNEDLLVQTVNTSSENIFLFNLYSGVTLRYYSTSESLNKFKAKILADCELMASDMNIIEQTNRTAGENYHVDISCQEGFAFLQEEYNYTSTLKAICTEGGVWNFGSETFKRYPKCQVVFCGVPLPIKNGFIEKLNNVTYNDTVSHKCFKGFSMNGPDSSVCQSNGSWSPAGSCEADHCGDIPEIGNGSYRFSVGTNSTHGSVVKYSCNPGYNLIGSQQIVCLKSKNWSDSAPQCKILTCNLPSVINGYYSNSDFTIEYNENVTLHCYGGYRNDRTNTPEATLQCGEDRNLTFTDSCIDIDECAENNLTCNETNMYCKNVNGSYDCLCQPGYNMTNSMCLDIDECENNRNICDHNCTNQAGSYTCSCEAGFDLYTSNGTNGFILPKEEDGTLPGHILHINHTCVRKLCEPLIIDNGTVLSKQEKFLYNDIVKVVCDFGFLLGGASLAYCSSTGYWTFNNESVPTCKVLSCPVPGPSKLELSRDRDGSSIKGGDSMKIICEQQCENCGNITKTVYCALDSSKEFQLQGDNPECFAVNCGHPLWEQLPGVVRKEMNDTTYGSSFEFECDPEKGFAIQGNSSLGNHTVMCQRNGRWGLNSLRCQVLYCKDPGTKAGTEQKVKYSYEVGQSVQYSCTRPGFRARPNDTITCEYFNGTARWSRAAPECEDAVEPEITCPDIPPFNLYDTLIYSPPNITDNSGYACLVLESGPPSGVSVVSKNMMLRFKAFDIAYNAVNISCPVTLKDQTRPWIQCPGTIDYDMSELNELVNVDSFKAHIVHSNDGNITVNPLEINLTLGNVYNVTASITKDNGYYEQCAFLIQTKTTTCHNETLTAPQNGVIKECHDTGTSMTCIASCNEGYFYQNLSTEISYSCTNGIWSSETPLLPCLKFTNTIFLFNMSVQYEANNLNQFDKTFCIGSHNNYLTQLINNMTACNLSQFSIGKLDSDEMEIPGEFISKFSLIVVTNGEDEDVLENCTQYLNSSNHFGPTYPASDCKPPWTVKNISVTPGHLHCPNGHEWINKTFCLQCGHGYYFNNSHCIPCSNGTYQDKEGQIECENCVSGISYWPRTSKKHCQVLCPDGFTSPSGFINDNCTQCSVNTYSSEDRTTCLQCNSTTPKYQCSVSCKLGEYSSTGYEPCLPCPKHFFGVDFNFTTCQECPEDTYTVSNGSKWRSDCLNVSDVDCSNYCTKPRSNSDCSIKDHLVTCKCLEGYYGHRCEDTCNFCKSKPCENEGTCFPNGSHFTCQCKTAPNCTFVRDQSIKFTTDSAYVNYSSVRNRAECEEQCLNESDCLAYLYGEPSRIFCYKYHQILTDLSGNSYQSYRKNCTNKTLFGGDHCEVDLINDCDTKNVCSEKDFCMDLIDATRCVCPLDGMYNATCYKESNMCDPDPCTHGHCETFGTVRYICVCDPGYTGENCTDNIDECNLNPFGCINNGNCTDNVNNYTCSCISEFKGNNCEVPPALCEGNQCLENSGGLCIEDYYNMSHICVCAENYNLTIEGQHPSCQAIDFCLSSPCQNGGTCANKTDGFSCNCSDGFEGSRCQIKIMIKENETTCENVNICNSTMKEYFCEQCQSQNTTCTACLDKCRNFSTAEERFLCQCFCQEPTTNNHCLLYEPCLHGGTCSNTTDGYTCECPTGWKGKNCEIAIDYCNNTSPCENSANCSNLINGTFCHCMDGTSGVKCEEKKDICEYFGNNTCKFGTCESDGGAANCVCQNYFTGKSCELLKNHCSADLCNGGKCYLNDISFECNCDDVHHGAGEYCNATSNSCDKCPHSYNCTIYTDKEGINQSACLCPPDKIHTGNMCSDVEKDFDLVFLKDFASSNKFLTSVMGFSLENVDSLTVTMWVAAAHKLNDDDIILSLTSAQDENFLSILNSKIKFKSTSFNNSFLDSENKWHMIAVTWTTRGQCSIYFDFSLINASICDPLPNVRFATVQLGKRFYGYISYVQLWDKTLTFDEILQLYQNKSYVPHASNLLLDWTYFSLEENALISRPSLAKRETTICENISSSALFPLQDICKENTEDKSPPLVNGECKSWKLIETDYNQHQVSSSELVYTFIDSTNNNLQQPKLQFFSYGAYDIAVAANDSSGNIGVCMTRTFITYNQCNNTKPIEFVDSCSNSTGVRVNCPVGLSPSVQIPKLLACGQLKTFNLDHMYEKPDMIVCGNKSSRLVTIKIHLEYTLSLDCTNDVNIKAKEEIRKSILKMAGSWTGLCKEPQCSNALINGNCGNKLITIEAVINNIGERLNSTTNTDQSLKTLEIVKNTVEDGKTFNISAQVAGAKLQSSSTTFTFSCLDGSTLIENLCVECGEGSFYNKVTKNCELCPLNYYGNASRQCFPCPDKKVTLQRGSSSVSECVLNCTVGYMLNETINQCVPCPHNFYQDQPGKHYCLPCPPSHGTNTNGTAQLGACTEFCPPGTQRNNSGLCEPCPRGSYRVGDKEDQCSLCPVDLTTADIGHDRESDCIIPICSPGMFANSTNATNYTCADCEIGHYQPDNASISCIPCSDNYTTVHTGSNNITQCLFYCEAGSEESPLDSKNCMPCQRGFYRPGDIFNRFLNCSQCPHGLTTDREKSVSRSDCNIKICSSGNVLSSNLSTCQPCPHDTYQPLNQPNSTTVCLSCTIGHGTVNVASNSSTDCKLFCQPGNGSGNSGSCEECKQGFWNNGNSSMRFEPCQKCPVNYTTEGAGATDVNNCSLRDCPSGTYIKGHDCIPCELGTYQPLPYQTQCNNCRANTSTSSIASTSPDDCTIECPAGNEGNASDNCVPCGDDEHKSEENYGRCQNCTGDFTSEPNNRTHCTIVHCNYGREYNNGNCSDCTKGYYKEVRGNVNCMKCPGNRSTAGQGSTSLSQCNITYCEPGFFSADNSTCMACPIGFYKNETGNQECTFCPENLTSSGVGSTHIANCSLRLCPVGYHRLNDSFCSPCGIGEYQNETGQIECKKCPLINNLNSTTFNTTSTNISDCYPVCGPGHFLDMTAKVCTQCPYGSYKNTTDLNTTCQQCPSNFTTTSTGATSELQCEYIICGKGEYRPNNTQTKCLKCPIGTYKAVSTYEPTNCTQCQTNNTTLIEGATSMKYCILNCPGGEQYSLLEENCTPCPVGQFKENSTVLNVCKYCAANLTTLTSGATSCIQSSAPQPAEINITITVYVDIHLGSCDNQVHLKNFIHEIITSVVKTARKNKFPGLCPTDACDNMIYVILEICGNQGKKRQTSDTARVKLDLKDIVSPLADLDGTKRNTERAVAELFLFGTLPFEDLMMSNAVTITNVTVQVVCPEGYSYNTVQWHCIQCTAGKYVNKAQCEDCPKGSYSTNPPSNICEQCPEHQTTNKTDSDNVSDCKGVCYFDNSYCGGSGQCQVNSATGIHECKCNENYQGFQCAERYSSENKDTMNIVVGISVALGVLLFIVLLTLALCIKRNRKKSKKSTASDTDYLSQRTPDFNQPVMFQNPAMFNDPTLYNGDVMEFYDHDPSVYRKSSGLSDAYLANGSRLSVHSRQREYTP